MFRISRLLVPLTSIAAIVALTMLLAPIGARGSDPAGAQSSDRNGGFNMSGDQYIFGHHAEVTSPVHGSLQVYGGNVDVRNVVDGDLLVFGGDVTIRESGRVNGNLIHAGGRIEGADRVGGRVHSLATMEGATATMTKTAVIASLLFVWLIAAVVLTLMSGREVRFSSTELRVSALHCFALGLVALTSFVLTAILFSYLVPYVVGIPLLAVLTVFAILTKIYGMIAVFHTIGTLVAGSRTREQLASRKWLRGDVAMVVIGVLILGAIRLIPILGTIVWACASVFGVGVALATKFGRREPWFLAWRTAEV